jgi:beta-galactosidase
LRHDADQVIAVRVDNRVDQDVAPLSADFTFFGGLYRMVHLVSTEDLHLSLTDFGSSAVYLQTSNVSASSAELQVTAKVVNDGPAPRRPTLETTVIDASGREVSQLHSDLELTGGSEADLIQATTIPNPHLWDGLTDPYLYQARLRVLDNGRTTDEVTQPLGFRSFSVDASSGFWLNAHPYRLYGVNKHQDRLDVGWAVTDANLDQDWSLVKEIGATAVRLAHYQHAQHTYDLADQGGQIIWAELPIINRITDSTAFAGNARQQLKELIRQNFNHPSIAFWSISNEATLSRGPDPRPLLTSLNDLVHYEDPTRLSTHASAGESPDVNTDVFGSNRYFGWYYGSYDDVGPWADRTHAAHPEWRIGMSEYGAGSSVLANFHTDTPRKQDPPVSVAGNARGGCECRRSYWVERLRPLLRPGYVDPGG